MLKRIQALVAAVALGSAAFVALPAAAATAADAPPKPTGLTAAPSPVVVSSDAGTTATFTFKTGDTGSARLIDRNDKSVPLTVTGSSGTYTAQYTFKFSDEPGVWKLEAKATKGSESSVETTTFQVHWVTDLDFDATPDAVEQGGAVTLRGALTYKEGSAWKQYDGQKVYIAFKPAGGSYSRVDSATTDSHGRFSVTRKSWKTGWWRAEFDGATDTQPSTSDSDRVDVKASSKATRISGFDAYPEPVDKGDTLHLRGTLEIGSWKSWDGYKGRRVEIFFKADGGSGWRYVTSDWTDSHGRFYADAEAQASGWWRAEYDGSSGIKGSTGAADHVTVRAPQPAPRAATRIIKFDAGPEPVKHGRYLSLHGKVQVWDAGWEGYGHQKVSLWFKKAGGGWKYVKTTWTNGSGKFWTKAKAVRSGTWKAVFGGDDEARGSASRQDWVRVKH
ncbi:hypothetical protein [Microbispora sp. NPDC049125]|uniref:hypothetical protein n=1 Tax=Microbispora sp. NPDC049125 TaxID=3154929 RepID=UPI0034667CD4